MSASEPQINPANVERDFVVFATNLFRDEQHDDEIDQWFLGEDCARWFEAKLLALDGISPGVSPLEEDWHGWTFGIRAHGIWFWLRIWHWISVWVVEVEAKPGPLGIFRRERTRRAKAMLCHELDSILASAPEIESREWLEAHPAELPRLVVTDPNKLHVAAGPTYETRSWGWRLFVPKQAKLRLFIASEKVPADGFPMKYSATRLPKGEMPLRVEVCQGPNGQWRIRAVYPSGLSGLDIPEGHTAWILEPDGYSATQTGLQGTEVTAPDEPVVLLRLRAKPRGADTG